MLRNTAEGHRGRRNSGRSTKARVGSEVKAVGGSGVAKATPALREERMAARLKHAAKEAFQLMGED